MKTIIPLKMQLLKSIITAFVEAECRPLPPIPALSVNVRKLTDARLVGGIARQTMNAIPAQVVEPRETGLHGGDPGGGEGVGWRRGGGGGEEAGCGWGGPG